MTRANKIISINEYDVTNGMMNVLGKHPKSDKKCQGCGFEFPSYPGRYPNTCPKCGGTNVTSLSNDEPVVVDNKDWVAAEEQPIL